MFLFDWILWSMKNRPHNRLPVYWFVRMRVYFSRQFLIKLHTMYDVFLLCMHMLMRSTLVDLIIIIVKMNEEREEEEKNRIWIAKMVNFITSVTNGSIIIDQ